MIIHVHVQCIYMHEMLHINILLMRAFVPQKQIVTLFVSSLLANLHCLPSFFRWTSGAVQLQQRWYNPHSVPIFAIFGTGPIHNSLHNQARETEGQILHRVVLQRTRDIWESNDYWYVKFRPSYKLINSFSQWEMVGLSSGHTSWRGQCPPLLWTKDACSRYCVLWVTCLWYISEGNIDIRPSPLTTLLYMYIHTMPKHYENTTCTACASSGTRNFPQPLME